MEGAEKHDCYSGHMHGRGYGVATGMDPLVGGPGGKASGSFDIFSVKRTHHAT